jgi:maltose alpha-D-glucosyltransferase/alpha-amylase
MEEGPNPDLELSRYLDEYAYHCATPILGHVELRRRRRRSEPITLAVLHRYVVNQGNAWQYTLDQLASFFERVAALSHEATGAPQLSAVSELASPYGQVARLLGERTAELHRALAAATEASLAPEPLDRGFQRSHYQSLRNLTGQLLSRLAHEKNLPQDVRPLAERLVASKRPLLDRFHRIIDPELESRRIRCHGDYHLGQLLYTGNSFVLIDLEGNPSRTLGERRLKRSPLRDVASMVRSFDYASGSVLCGLSTGKGRPPGLVRCEDRAALAGWARAWVEHVSREFADSYLEHMGMTDLIPPTPSARRRLLDLQIMERTLQEIEFELTYRPAWLIIPLQAAVRMIEESS